MEQWEFFQQFCFRQMAGWISKICIWKQMRRNLGKWSESYRLLQGEQIFHLQESERWVASEKIYDSDARRTFYMYMRRGKEKLWTEHHSEGYNPKWLTFELLSYLLRALSQLIKVNFFSLLQKNSQQLIAEISASTYWTTGFYSLLRSSGILKSPIHSIIILFFIHNVL